MEDTLGDVSIEFREQTQAWWIDRSVGAFCDQVIFVKLDQVKGTKVSILRKIPEFRGENGHRRQNLVPGPVWIGLPGNRRPACLIPSWTGIVFLAVNIGRECKRNLALPEADREQGVVLT